MAIMNDSHSERASDEVPLLKLVKLFCLLKKREEKTQNEAC